MKRLTRQLPIVLAIVPLTLGCFHGVKKNTAPSPTGPFTFHNASSIGYCGENATIITECSTGDLYMFQIEGYGSSDVVDKVHLYKLVLNNGMIALPRGGRSCFLGLSKSAVNRAATRGQKLIVDS